MYQEFQSRGLEVNSLSSASFTKVHALHPILNPIYEAFGTGTVRKPAVKVHVLEEPQLKMFDRLFPDRSWVVRDHMLTAGLPYLESLTDIAAEDAFQKMHSRTTAPELVYVVGEGTQLFDSHAEHLWNIESPTDDFSSYSNVRSCTHQLQDQCECAGSEPDAFLLIHSLYYFTPQDFARALYRSTHRYALSIHHPFHAVQGQLGFDEVQFNVAHGRVSTTRFPSYDRSDLSWLYTKDQFNFYVNDHDELVQFDISEGFPPELESAHSIHTLYWELIQDSHDIQVVQFGLRKGLLPSLPKTIATASWSGVSLGRAGYGPLAFDQAFGEVYAEQVWDQVSLQVKGGEVHVFSTGEVQRALQQHVSASSVSKSLEVRCQEAMLSLRNKSNGIQVTKASLLRI